MLRNKTIANIDNNRIESENIHENLGITSDSRLTFENHINKLCKKASQKLNASAGISNSMTSDRKKDNNESFYITTQSITSQVSYPADNYLLKVNNRNTSAFIAKFEHAIVG